MPQPFVATKQTARITSLAYLGSCLMNAPFWTMYSMLLFILYKDLHASPLQISILIALKPVVSLLSIYWSSFVHNRPDRLRFNVVAAGFIGHLPFFFSPWISEPWFYIASGALYMMVMRGIIPAWMEILKLNLPENRRSRIFSFGSAISYIGGVILPLLFSSLLDNDSQFWRYLFPISAFISYFGLFFQWKIPLPKQIYVNATPAKLLPLLIKPWRDTWRLLSTRPDFRAFQWGFMLGGGGLMLMQPALPIFFVDFLSMSYTELAVAQSVCKGVGFALTTRLWATAMSKMSIFSLSGIVTLLAALFPLAILLGHLHLNWIYAAYLIYGIMQAGSELSWHLSGPLFAREKDSSVYSSVNVATVGLRGLIAPFIGSLFCTGLGATWALLIGGFFCLAASFYLRLCRKGVLFKNA